MEGKAPQRVHPPAGLSRSLPETMLAEKANLPCFGGGARTRIFRTCPAAAGSRPTISRKCAPACSLNSEIFLKFRTMAVAGGARQGSATKRRTPKNHPHSSSDSCADFVDFDLIDRIVGVSPCHPQARTGVVALIQL